MKELLSQREKEEDIEFLSEVIHKLYCVQFEKDHGKPYWTEGDYSKLEERVKEYDRNIARFIISQKKLDRAETTRLMVEEFKNKLQENFKKYYITQKVEGNDRKKVVSYEEFVQSLTEL